MHCGIGHIVHPQADLPQADTNLPPPPPTALWDMVSKQAVRNLLEWIFVTLVLLMLMMRLGVNGAIETNVFLSHVNACVTADAWCKLALTASQI